MKTFSIREKIDMLLRPKVWNVLTEAEKGFVRGVSAMETRSAELAADALGRIAIRIALNIRAGKC